MAVTQFTLNFVGHIGDKPTCDVLYLQNVQGSIL